MKNSEFAIKVFNDRSNKIKKKKFATVSKAVSKKILTKTGLDVTGYKHVLDTYGVIHTINKHGNPATEKSRGLIAINFKDFDLLADVVRNFDNIQYVGTNKAGRNLLSYSKKVNGYIFYLEEIRSLKSKELIIQSMYIKPKKS
jgi:hypothetical protein